MIQAVGTSGSTTALTTVSPISPTANPRHGDRIVELLSTLVALMAIPEMIFYVMI